MGFPAGDRRAARGGGPRPSYATDPGRRGRCRGGTSDRTQEPDEHDRQDAGDDGGTSREEDRTRGRDEGRGIDSGAPDLIAPGADHDQEDPGSDSNRRQVSEPGGSRRPRRATGTGHRPGRRRRAPGRSGTRPRTFARWPCGSWRANPGQPLGSPGSDGAGTSGGIVVGSPLPILVRRNGPSMSIGQVQRLACLP